MSGDAPRRRGPRAGSPRLVAPEQRQLAMSEHDERERRIAEVAARAHGVITWDDLAALGMSHTSVRHRVHQRRLRREHRGVYSVGAAALTPQGRVLAAALACGRGAVVSHISAAATHDLLAWRQGAVDVTVPPGSGSRSRRGIRVFRDRPLPTAETTTVDGIPATTVARTLVDLGDVVRAGVLRRAFVSAEQRRLLDVAELDAALTRAGRRAGARLLGELLGVYDPRWSETRSDLELTMLDIVGRFALPEPEVNAWLLDRYLVDFLWRDARVVLETDGRTVHGTATARRDDARRDHALRRAGFTVLRATNREVRTTPAEVAARVAAALVAAPYRG